VAHPARPPRQSESPAGRTVPRSIVALKGFSRSTLEAGCATFGLCVHKDTVRFEGLIAQGTFMADTRQEALSAALTWRKLGEGRWSKAA